MKTSKEQNFVLACKLNIHQSTYIEKILKRFYMEKTCLIRPQGLQNLMQMLFMLCLCLGVNQNIINKYYDESVKKILEHSVHQIHEYSRDICQTKGYHNELIMLILRMKGCLQYVTISYPQLVISSVKVNFLEYSSPL